MKELDKGDRANTEESQNINQRSLPPEPTFLTTNFTSSQREETIQQRNSNVCFQDETQVIYTT